MEAREQEDLDSFVEQRICGNTNLWDTMNKLKPQAIGRMLLKPINSIVARGTHNSK